MWKENVYFGKIVRRPVHLGAYPALEDLQGALPRGWCCSCGGEIFRPGAELCARCSRSERSG